jgi:hypothetical protein
VLFFQSRTTPKAARCAGEPNGRLYLKAIKLPHNAKRCVLRPRPALLLTHPLRPLCLHPLRLHPLRLHPLRLHLLRLMCWGGGRVTCTKQQCRSLQPRWPRIDAPLRMVSLCPPRPSTSSGICSVCFACGICSHVMLNHTYPYPAVYYVCPDVYYPCPDVYYVCPDAFAKRSSQQHELRAQFLGRLGERDVHIRLHSNGALLRSG